MTNKPVWYYEAKLAFGVTSLLPALLLPGYALMVSINRETVISLPEIVLGYEVVLSLAAGLIAAHLMSVERETGMDELRRTYSEASWYKPFVRWVGGVACVVASGVLTVPLFVLGHGSTFVWGEILLHALAPALLLLTLALLLNAALGNYWAAAAPVAALWAGDLLSQGEVSGQWFLFAQAWEDTVSNYALNRGVLIAITPLLLLATVLWYARRRQRGG